MKYVKLQKCKLRQDNNLSPTRQEIEDPRITRTTDNHNKGKEDKPETCMQTKLAKSIHKFFMFFGLAKKKKRKKKKMGLGISLLIGLKAVLLFLLFAFLSSFGFALLAVPFLYASLVSLLVALASHPSINLPMLLAKNSDGSFPIWSIVLFSPYLYFVRVFSTLRRLFSGEAPYSEISDGLYVGGWPSSPDRLPPGNPAIVDCTCEFPRRSEFLGHAYFCIPTWDTRAPQPHEIESAVKWACRKREQNRPVFVHCAYGMLLNSKYL
ncbi:hypothetical protein FEM48_Zijuj03G0039100 [Ziziphus jujuba var. spinosa]|uniref:Tyrosine specific protein phosphatases domain-containing protein n=1 Tax=Ziziphus jujuba var. spinosa TaxID=714518 RepID=A0A978VN11_ZIZJJ|nr:hypothetical protein FEM48_Zijuj03G0039100 [Ziziphus jujuba var. spinosa]